jgi:branched-subunit amino acid transport protein
MSPLWLALLGAALGCYGLKLAGVSVPDSVLNHPRVQRTAGLLPVAMLSALVVVELFDGGGGYGWEPTTLLGVAAGGIALLLKQGVLAVFVVAVASTALLRVLL